MTRLARRSDRFRITTVKTETGQPVRYSTGNGNRWIWQLIVDDRATDDDVYLPYVYNRPVRDPLFGIRQEFVIDWNVGRKVLKFSSHRAACAVLAHILEGVGV